MAKNLVIVESPTKSKTIEKFLGRNYVVKASMGHLRDLPKSTFGVDVEHDFEPKYINIRGKGDIIKELKALAKKANKIYLATDPDREGEAISWHLTHILDLDPKQNCRIVFHEITSKTVKEAIKKPRPIDMDMVDAQQARRILDRIVGYQLSPLLWRKIRKGLSAGRVQSVAVKLVADRDKAIQEFIPKEYWTLRVKLREHIKKPIFEAEVFKYKNKKLEMTNEIQAREAETALSKADYFVSEAVKKERRRHPAPPLTTSSLQQEANRKLNFTAKKTMMLAQQLYEGVSLGKGAVGLITYMRTDSVRLAEEAITEIRNYIVTKEGQEFCPQVPNHFNTSKNAQDAHEAIRPTSVLRTPEEVAAYLSRDQLRLYQLIWSRAVASQMSDAVYDVTTMEITAGEYRLRASGSILKFPGFLQLAGRGVDDEKDKAVPYIAPGTKLLLHKLLSAEQHFTEPPAHYTEATLIKELEDKGIGRPSTYAPIIVTILSRDYVVKHGKQLLITDLGLLTIAMLTDYFENLINISFSAQMEAALDKIAEHKIAKNQVLHEFYEGFARDLERATVEIPHVEMPVEVTDIPCEKCGRMMVIKEGRNGKFLACPGFPECRNTKSILKKIGVNCPACGGALVERKTKTGKIFYGCENYPKCSYTTWDKPLTEKCSKCGANLCEHVDWGGRKHKYCSNPQCLDARPARVATKAKKSSGKKIATRKKGVK